MNSFLTKPSFSLCVLSLAASSLHLSSFILLRFSSTPPPTTRSATFVSLVRFTSGRARARRRVVDLLLLLLLVWRLHRALWHAISFIRNIMPCWTPLALAARPMHAPNPLSSPRELANPVQSACKRTCTQMHTYSAYVQQRPRDYIETVVNFNFVRPRPEGNLRSRNAAWQRTYMSKDHAESDLMKNCRCYRCRQTIALPRRSSTTYSDDIAETRRFIRRFIRLSVASCLLCVCVSWFWMVLLGWLE